MKAVLDAMVRLILTISRHPAAAFLAAFFIASIMSLWYFASNIEAVLHRFPTSVEQRARFERTITAQELIERELEVVRRELNADRLLISQFHNGSSDIVGSPFVFSSITYSALAPGVVLDARTPSSVPLAAYSYLLRAMWRDRDNPVCVQSRTEQVEPPALRARLESRGVSMIYVCPVVDRAGNPMGMISAEYMRAETRRPPSERIMAVIKESGKRVESYLAAIAPSPLNSRNR